jgi:hypothetical protein
MLGAFRSPITRTGWNLYVKSKFQELFHSSFAERENSISATDLFAEIHDFDDIISDDSDDLNPQPLPKQQTLLRYAEETPLFGKLFNIASNVIP